MNKPADEQRTQDWIRRWRNLLVIACIGMVALVLAVNWALSGFHSLGLHPATTIALVLGTIATTALCVVLMGLMFYSERTQDDEEAYERDTTDRWH
jgi:Kef-type K+ transport system membrane component KefB